VLALLLTFLFEQREVGNAVTMDFTHTKE